MMLGTAASNSMMKDSGVDNLDGAISERKMAIPRLMGTPIAIAIAEVIKVPIIYGSAPKASRPYTAFQSVLVKN
jgi:hypothetical protein